MRDKKKRTKTIAIIGSRILPTEITKSKVDFVIEQCKLTGCAFITGGAIGIDLHAIRSMIAQNACIGSVVYLPMSFWLAPLLVKPWLQEFQKLDGLIVPGLYNGIRPPIDLVLKAIFARNKKIADSADTVISFPIGKAGGTWSTCDNGVRAGKNIIVYAPADKLHYFKHHKWEAMESAWAGFHRLRPVNSLF